MAVDDDLLIGARKYERRSVEALLSQMYPIVHRMAHGLSGRADAARGVERFVMTQAVKRLPQWRDADAAERWFYHHTVLTSRRAAKHQPDARTDLLVTQDANADGHYVAFIKALRALTGQQREAYILHHGEKLNLRFLGISMDCSTRAAEMHLQSATEALEALAGGQYEAMRQRLADAYWSLTPTEELATPAAQKLISSALWPRRMRRLVRVVVVLAILCAGVYAWFRWGHLVPWPGE